MSYNQSSHPGSHPPPNQQQPPPQQHQQHQQQQHHHHQQQQHQQQQQQQHQGQIQNQHQSQTQQGQKPQSSHLPQIHTQPQNRPQHHPPPQMHPVQMHPGHPGHSAHSVHPGGHPQHQQQQQQQQQMFQGQGPAGTGIPPLAQAHVCICPNVTRVPRPRNAFILYRQHHHSIVVAENPGKSNPEISKIIGEQWRSLAQGEKDFWVQLSDEEKKSHLERFPDYRYQPRRNVKKNGGDTQSGVCSVCRGITSAGSSAVSSAYSTQSPRHSSSGSSFSSISSTHSSFSSPSTVHSVDHASHYPPPPPPPQGALFHPHHPHHPNQTTRYSYPTSVDMHGHVAVAGGVRHNSAPEPHTLHTLPRIIPRPQDDLEPHRNSVPGRTNSPSTAATPPTKHTVKFESTTPKMQEKPLQYSPAYHSPLTGGGRGPHMPGHSTVPSSAPSSYASTHPAPTSGASRLPPPAAHALIEEEHATKRRRTSSYHDPLAAPHHLPQQQRRSVRYKSAIAIASGRISPLVENSTDGSQMTMREKADALSMLCEPLPGTPKTRSKIVSIESASLEFGNTICLLVKQRLEAELQTENSNSFVTLHNVADPGEPGPTDSPSDNLACIINKKPSFITDGFASAMWNITCLHQLVSNYFTRRERRKEEGTDVPGVILLNGYLVTIADKFVQEHVLRQSGNVSTYSETEEAHAMERFKRDTSTIPEGDEPDSESGKAPTSNPASGSQLKSESGQQSESRKETPNQSPALSTTQSPSAKHSPLYQSSYLEEWMSSANLLRGLPSPDVMIYLQAEGSEVESSAVELRGEGKLIVIRGDESIVEKVVDKLVSIIKGL